MAKKSKTGPHLLFSTSSGGGGNVPFIGGTAKLMKTGQTTSYRTGDDGDLQEGRTTDFFTLAENNPFGNTKRFTDELGGSDFTNNILIDWSTYDGNNVLGYVVNFSTAGTFTWDDAIDYCLTYTNSGFSGWRLANRNELNNIADNQAAPLAYAPFSIIGSAIWSSTTLYLSTGFARALDLTAGDVLYYTKALTIYAMPVRNFTLAELGL